MGMRNRRAIVTGGAGFIGSHVVDRLVDEGYRVLAVDDLSSGRAENVNREADLEQIDIRGTQLADKISSYQPDAVFHLAAQPSVSVSARDPLLDAQVNVLGTVNLLHAMMCSGVPRLVFASTGGAIYGEPEGSAPVNESAPCKPMSPYGTSKLCCEEYIGLFRRSHGVRGTVLRLANIYGPRQDPHGEAGVVAIFSRAMLEGESVNIFGDGEDERDYVFVGDLVEAFLRAAESGLPGPFNIGTGAGTSVNELARKLISLTGYDLAPTYAPPRPGDIHRISLDYRTAENQLGWRPSVALEDGLTQTVGYFRHQHEYEGG